MQLDFLNLLSKGNPMRFSKTTIHKLSLEMQADGWYGLPKNPKNRTPNSDLARGYDVQIEEAKRFRRTLGDPAKVYCECLVDEAENQNLMISQKDINTIHYVLTKCGLALKNNSPQLTLWNPVLLKSIEVSLSRLRIALAKWFEDTSPALASTLYDLDMTECFVKKFLSSRFGNKYLYKIEMLQGEKIVDAYANEFNRTRGLGSCMTGIAPSIRVFTKKGTPRDLNRLDAYAKSPDIKLAILLPEDYGIELGNSFMEDYAPVARTLVATNPISKETSYVRVYGDWLLFEQCVESRYPRLKAMSETACGWDGVRLYNIFYKMNISNPLHHPPYLDEHAKGFRLLRPVDVDREKWMAFQYYERNPKFEQQLREWEDKIISNYR